MRIALTGAAGFIGSAIAARLNRLGYKDLIISDERDHLGNEKRKNLDSVSYEKFEDKELFLENIGKIKRGYPQVVIHMGACSSTTEDDAAYLMDTNYEYTRKLCLICLEKGIRFIYASSAATYGDGSMGFSDDHSFLKRYKPLNLYGLSKHKFDLWALENNFLDKIAGLKYFNVYGPNEYHKGDMSSFVLKAFNQIKRKGGVELFKSYRKDYAHGEQKRDFIYVKDAVDMTLEFMHNKNACGIYNIGTSAASAWNSLAGAVFKSMGKKVNIKYVDMPENIKENYQYYTKAEMKKFKDAGLKFSPLPLEDGIFDYVSNYLSGGKRMGGG